MNEVTSSRKYDYFLAGLILAIVIGILYLAWWIEWHVVWQ